MSEKSKKSDKEKDEKRVQPKRAAKDAKLLKNRDDGRKPDDTVLDPSFKEGDQLTEREAEAPVEMEEDTEIPEGSSAELVAKIRANQVRRGEISQRELAALQQNEIKDFRADEGSRRDRRPPELLQYNKPGAPRKPGDDEEDSEETESDDDEKARGRRPRSALSRRRKDSHIGKIQDKLRESLGFVTAKGRVKPSIFFPPMLKDKIDEKVYLEALEKSIVPKILAHEPTDELTLDGEFSTVIDVNDALHNRTFRAVVGHFISDITPLPQYLYFIVWWNDFTTLREISWLEVRRRFEEDEQNKRKNTWAQQLYSAIQYYVDRHCDSEIQGIVKETGGLPQLDEEKIPTKEKIIARLQDEITGQSYAIEEIAERLSQRLEAIEAPEEARDGPLVLFLVGPSGYGKTTTGMALAKILFETDKELTAQELDMIYLQVDLANYRDPLDAGRLFGATVGTEGSDQPGLLSKMFERVQDSAIKRSDSGARPVSAVLHFDELDKAHSSTLIQLMELFDRGVMREANRSQQQFIVKKLVIVVTANTAEEMLVNAETCNPRKFARAMRYVHERIKQELGENQESVLARLGPPIPFFGFTFDEQVIVTHRTLYRTLYAISKRQEREKRRVATIQGASWIVLVAIVQNGFNPQRTRGVRAIDQYIRATILPMIRQFYVDLDKVAGKTYPNHRFRIGAIELKPPADKDKDALMVPADDDEKEKDKDKGEMSDFPNMIDLEAERKAKELEKKKEEEEKKVIIKHKARLLTQEYDFCIEAQDLKGDGKWAPFISLAGKEYRAPTHIRMPQWPGKTKPRDGDDVPFVREPRMPKNRDKPGPDEVDTTVWFHPEGLHQFNKTKKAHLLENADKDREAAEKSLAARKAEREKKGLAEDEIIPIFQEAWELATVPNADNRSVAQEDDLTLSEASLAALDKKEQDILDAKAAKRPVKKRVQIAEPERFRPEVSSPSPSPERKDNFEAGALALLHQAGAPPQLLGGAPPKAEEKPGKKGKRRSPSNPRARARGKGKGKGKAKEEGKDKGKEEKDKEGDVALPQAAAASTPVVKIEDAATKPTEPKADSPAIEPGHLPLEQRKEVLHQEGADDNDDDVLEPVQQGMAGKKRKAPKPKPNEADKLSPEFARKQRNVSHQVWMKTLSAMVGHISLR